MCADARSEAILPHHPRFQYRNVLEAAVSEGAQEVHRIGKYELLATLGRGAMGVVYKARDPEIGRLVAIKTLRRIEGEGEEMRESIERFRNEARSAGNLRHPNIITVYEVSLDGNMPFIAMEYIDGDSLDALILRYGKLPPQLAIAYLMQAATAVDYAHSKGVVHRDLKPSNIVIDQSDTVYVLDFGVAAISKSYTDWETPTEVPLMGTPGYLAPEQISKQMVDRRSDLFSLAVVAFECFTGRRPFGGEGLSGMMQAVLHSTPLSLTSLVPTLPLALEAEFERALAKRPDERFATAQDMVEAFAGALALPLPNLTNSAINGRALLEASLPPGSRAIEKPTPPIEDLLPVAPPQRAERSVDRVPNAEGSFTTPAKPLNGRRERTPGDMFAHINDPLTGGVESLARRRTRLIRQVVLACAIASFVVAGVLGAQMFLSNDPVETASVQPRPVQPVNPISAVGELREPRTDPVPPGKAVSEMTDRELLGVLKSSEVAEVVTLAALKEAHARRLPDLVDISKYPLESDSYVVRVETIKLLGEIGDRRIVPKLLLRLDDHDPLVRGFAARTLGMLGDRRALGYLSSKLIQEQTPEVRNAMKKAIENINGYPMK